MSSAVNWPLHKSLSSSLHNANIQLEIRYRGELLQKNYYVQTYREGTIKAKATTLREFFL